jgi:hypothetical protein
LKDYIVENSTPEHNKNWLRAEEITSQMKGLQKEIASSKSPINQLINAGKKIGSASTLGVGLKALGLSAKTGAIAGGLSLLGHKMVNEVKYLNQLASSSPRLYKEYMDTLKHAGKVEAAKTAQRLNRLAEKANEELPIETRTPEIEIPSEAFDYNE